MFMYSTDTAPHDHSQPTRESARRSPLVPPRIGFRGRKLGTIVPEPTTRGSAARFEQLWGVRRSIDHGTNFILGFFCRQGRLLCFTSCACTSSWRAEAKPPEADASRSLYIAIYGVHKMYLSRLHIRSRPLATI